ncbi:hypothetical protein V6U90_23295 [Micromonospora sp. CPCC 206060]|uniref:hypothetical protein n=1 Tax=Micromonospora sp. CPCC 206060 TaxID=3122406 RepID=UPI002FF373BE
MPDPSPERVDRWQPHILTIKVRFVGRIDLPAAPNPADADAAEKDATTSWKICTAALEDFSPRPAWRFSHKNAAITANLRRPAVILLTSLAGAVPSN